MTHLRFCNMYAHMSKDKKNTGRNKEIGKMHAQKAMKELGICPLCGNKIDEDMMKRVL